MGQDFGFNAAQIARDGRPLSELAITDPTPLQSTVDAAIAKLRGAARDAADASKAPATERAYADGWRDFSARSAALSVETLFQPSRDGRALRRRPCRPRQPARHDANTCPTRRSYRSYRSPFVASKDLMCERHVDRNANGATYVSRSDICVSAASVTAYFSAVSDVAAWSRLDR